jgi:tetratricopeptide (TPR) repeat protein
LAVRSQEPSNRRALKEDFMLLPVFVLAATLPLLQEPVAPQAPPPEAPEAAPAAEAAPAVEAAPAASADALIEAGLKAFARRRYTQAEIEFRKALEAAPDSAAAAYYLGYTYYKAAEPKRPFHPDKQKAAEMFAKAWELEPTFRPVWSKR